VRYIILFFITLVLVACKDKTTQPSQKYDNMLFDREGGGNLIFIVAPTAGTDAFQVNVARLSYRDTLISIALTRDAANAAAFDALSKTLDGQNQIAGTFKQDTALIVGTWAFVYVVKNNTRTEITNVDLRNVLLTFEQLVKAKL
jgi:hypothetical protein